MNGIERITQRIAVDAQEEINEILRKGREEASAITERYRAQAESERNALSERNEKAAAEREERLVSMAQMEARKVTLAARQEMVEAAYDKALELLCEMPDHVYIDALADLLVAASMGGKEEAVFSKKDRERVGQKAVDKANAKGKTIALSKETADIRGGFILKGEKVEVNCAFETLVRLQRAETAGAVVRTLFPEQGDKTNLRKASVS
ncbi:MAG: V-type ATP synthase subunit E [Oscillospiraceae bacterium]|nr:V-type ATP synthase subunit E [Oscillospiraceae bacterium]